MHYQIIQVISFRRNTWNADHGGLDHVVNGFVPAGVLVREIGIEGSSGNLQLLTELSHRDLVIGRGDHIVKQTAFDLLPLEGGMGIVGTVLSHRFLPFLFCNYSKCVGPSQLFHGVFPKNSAAFFTRNCTTGEGLVIGLTGRYPV